MITHETCPLCGTPAIPLEKGGLFRYGHCPLCSGIFMERSSLLDPEAEKRQYLTHNNDVHDTGYRNFVSPLVEIITERENPSHLGLDYGAGTGPVVATMLEEKGYEITLWDPYFIPDASALYRTYDFIFACEVIEHFHNPKESFEHLKSLLNENGVIYCRTTLVPDNQAFSAWGYKNEETHVFFYHEKTIAWIARQILLCDYEIHSRNIISFFRR